MMGGTPTISKDEAFEKLKDALHEIASEPFEGEWVNTSPSTDEDLKELNFNQD